jgi:hypothetical protein
LCFCSHAVVPRIAKQMLLSVSKAVSLGSKASSAMESDFAQKYSVELRSRTTERQGDMIPVR